MGQHFVRSLGRRFSTAQGLQRDLRRKPSPLAMHTAALPRLLCFSAINFLRNPAGSHASYGQTARLHGRCRYRAALTSADTVRRCGTDSSAPVMLPLPTPAPSPPSARGMTTATSALSAVGLARGLLIPLRSHPKPFRAGLVGVLGCGPPSAFEGGAPSYRARGQITSSRPGMA
jgi:hypothetical protein